VVYSQAHKVHPEGHRREGPGLLEVSVVAVVLILDGHDWSGVLITT
jgi:hypothetical protein